MVVVIVKEMVTVMTIMVQECSSVAGDVHDDAR